MPNVILAEFEPWDPVAGVAVTVRACSIDDCRVTTLNTVRWWPAIARAPRRTLDLFDGEFGGSISAGIGEIEIALAAFPNAARYAWGERPVKLWRGALGAGFGSYVQTFAGLTRPPRAGAGRMRLGLRVDDRWLDKPLLSPFAGTGGVEGPADLKGVSKPLALGAPQFVEGVIVNRTLNIVRLHGYGAMHGVPTALSRLSRYSAAAGNDANYAALAAATIASGAWRTCLAEGLVRFGAPPGGVLSFLTEGDSGSALGWVRTPGQVIRRIALIAGATTGQIDTASLAALDAACPYNISLYLREQTTARDVIRSIAASCNAAAGVSWLGKLFVTRAAIGTPALVLAANGSALPPVASVEMLESSAPFWRTALEAERTERVHSSGEFETLTDGAYSDGTSLDALRPATAGATRNIVTYSMAAPASPLDGDLWVDLSGMFAVFRLRSGGAWVVGANALSTYNALSGRPIALADINTTESGKLAGIADGATRDRAGNMLKDVDFDATRWSFQGGASRRPGTYLSSTYPAAWLLDLACGNTGYQSATSQDAFAAIAGRAHFVGARFYDNAATRPANIGIIWFDVAGAQLPFSGGNPAPAGLLGTIVEYSEVAPNDAVAGKMTIYMAAAAATGGQVLASNPYTRMSSAGADITARTVPALRVPAGPIIRYDFAGAALADQLPRTAKATRTRGGVDVSASTTWSCTPVSCSASIDTTGLVTITAVTSNGRVVVTSTRDGTELVGEFSVTKDFGAPPSTGGAGASSASDSSIASISAATYGGTQAGTLTVTAGSAGTVTLSAPLSFSVGAGSTIGARGKWLWRIVGGSFADVAAEITSTTSAQSNEPDSGSIDVSQTKTGLTAGSVYEFDLQLRRSSGSGAVNFGGTATAVAS